ncbi:ABC transporter permease [Caenispirillum bisanense]|uniref:Monosaccharide ABC transporter membrane protein, CUT2 family n=1 Tax=Caenispirillum bisanense TaxID=414052 RepID=A0A286GRV0_9PROT|nr:ABC transporter permease [Caenispirillum bisanense]SOD98263.1 monosaccharide ABC transporter membrane protein, CUT2 family [Caenispirillum bisanense]
MKFQTDFRSLLNRDNNIAQLLIMTVLIFVVMTALSPDKFLRYYNFESITYIFPELGLLSIAMMIAMLTGGIDLSVVGIANLSGILAGVLFHRLAQETGVADTGVMTVLLGGVVAVGTGVVAGALNGFLITRLRITPILATLGTGQVFTGLAIVLTGGPAIVGFPQAWAFLGNGKILGIATPFVLFVVLAIVIAFILSRTAFGINLLLIGTNPKAALFAGLKRERMIFYSYMLTGVLASVAGIILSGRTNAAKSDYGTSYLLQAVLIAVLGGTNPAGGKGTVLGVSIAVVALMLLSSGFQILRFSNHLIDFIWGAFLLLVIAINAYKNRTR